MSPELGSKEMLEVSQILQWADSIAENGQTGVQIYKSGRNALLESPD